MESEEIKLCKNRTNIPDKDWWELHKTLFSTVLQFFKEHGVPYGAYDVRFMMDEIDEAVKYNDWTPINDSCLDLYDLNDDILISSM